MNYPELGVGFGEHEENNVPPGHPVAPTPQGRTNRYKTRRGKKNGQMPNNATLENNTDGGIPKVVSPRRKDSDMQNSTHPSCTLRTTRHPKNRFVGTPTLIAIVKQGGPSVSLEFPDT